MAWGLIIKEIPLVRVHENQLEEAVADSLSMENHYKDQIKALAYGAPRDIDRGDYKEPWEEYAPRQLEQLLIELEEVQWRKAMCQYALDNPEDVTEY